MTGDLPLTLVTLGAVFLVGLATDALGRRTRLPRVTLLLLFGLGIGGAGLDLLASVAEVWFEAVASVALVMVGFLLGETLTLPELRQRGRQVLAISLTVVGATVLAVAVGLAAAGAGLAAALLLAGVATATDPAASVDVVRESGAHGSMARTLLGVVAVDDVWGVVAFSILLAAAQALHGDGMPVDALIHGLREILGGLALGAALGVPMALLTGRLRPGEPTLLEALGAVFLCCGLALSLEVSFLLAAVAMGCVVANLARHHDRPFHAIENIEWPFMVLFFVFAGASLRPQGAASSLGLLAGYVVLRGTGRLAGGWLGGWLGGAPRSTRRWLGVALMPQAGVALGMALVAAQRFPELEDTLLPVVLAATVLFEALGPVLTRLALARAGEAA